MPRFLRNFIFLVITGSAFSAGAAQQYATVAVDSSGLPISVLPDGGHGAVAVNQFTTNGQLDAGLYSLTTLPGNENAKLPFNFILPDAGNVATFSATSAVNLLLTGAGSVTITAAGGLTNTGIFTSTGVVRPSPAVALTDAVTLGQLDAGISGTIPGLASGLGANSIAQGPFNVSGADLGTIAQNWNYPDGGTYAIMYSGGFLSLGDGSGGDGVSSSVGSFGNFGTFPNDVLQVAGSSAFRGPAIIEDHAGAGHAAFYFGSGNYPAVFDGSSKTTGGSIAELIVKDATVSTHAATLGQLNAIESTLFSMSPNALLVVSTAIGGHKLGSAGYTVTGITLYKSIVGVGTGNVVIRVSDGTNNCDAPIPCATLGTARGVAAASTGTCAFSASAVLTATPSGITGTCSVLPTVLNVDVVGHQ